MTITEPAKNKPRCRVSVSPAFVAQCFPDLQQHVQRQQVQLQFTVDGVDSTPAGASLGAGVAAGTNMIHCLSSFWDCKLHIMCEIPSCRLFLDTRSHPLCHALHAILKSIVQSHQLVAITAVLIQYQHCPGGRFLLISRQACADMLTTQQLLQNRCCRWS